MTEQIYSFVNDLVSLRMYLLIPHFSSYIEGPALQSVTGTPGKHFLISTNFVLNKNYINFNLHCREIA